ncbi:hypothetical protein BSP109_03212 [Brevibacterium sp. Mu109]|nr:hypothetical protein [Brevibacterium sp. Mu109]SMY00417.1 hypothetical protein BSP109_03212 [Brevibacterium sp. Mu109]
MNETTMTPRAAIRHAEGRDTRTAGTEADEASALARHKDPSVTGKDAVAETEKARGVEWVRPSDLLASRSQRVAGRGIDFQAELVRRSRRVPVRAVRATGRGITKTGAAISERARKLPPVTAFGRGAGERHSWVSRSGIGLG